MKMRKTKYDGRVGKYYYRAGRVCGCWNLFKPGGKYAKSVTAGELFGMQEASRRARA